MPSLPGDKDFSLIISDDARPELGDKITILGFYSGGNIGFLGGQPPYMLPTITFIYIFKSGDGTFKVRFSLIAPDGSAVIESAQLPDLVKLPNLTATFVMQFRPVMFNSLGNYTARLVLDNKSYDTIIPITQTQKQ